MKLTLIFCILSLMLLCARVCSIFAKAPTTPKILFTSTRDGNREVYSMNPDGSEQVNLTQHPAEDLEAVWSPTGEQILFVSNRRDLRPRGNRDLYLMDPDGSNVRHVFKRKIEAWRENPTWSPDGKQFAYSSIDWGRLEFACHIAPLGEQESEFLVDGSFPAWSPDGTEIACTVVGRLTLINVRTGAQKQLLPKNVESFQRDPSWSAVGDKLAFAWNKHPLPPPNAEKRVHDVWQDKTTIYIINRDGTDLQQLVEEAGPYAQSPALSPDGKEVLYTREIKGHFQIFKLDLNSGIRTQLTHILGWNTGGDWFDPAYALPVSPQPQLLTTTWGTLKRE
ncbi:PD40 domain-containing protein [Candidatus Poribacteria bacterium]|nr:PD40 domain-containing protein [Candidatus Poribacteria bacterium]